MSAWTPAHHDYATTETASGRGAAAVSLIAVGIAFAAAALYEVTQPQEPAWLAAFALVLAMLFAKVVYDALTKGAG